MPKKEENKKDLIDKKNIGSEELTINQKEIDDKIFLFHQGTYYKSYEFLGCHEGKKENKKGYYFRVLAPNAKDVFLVGDFNNWQTNSHQMKRIKRSGIWEIFIEGLKEFDLYKFYVVSKDNKGTYKSDPYAFYSETNGKTASKIYNPFCFKWGEEEKEFRNKNENVYESPMNIYEINFSSWKKNDDGSYYTYLQLKNELIPYIKELGYTHIEIMPLNEYPFDGSWGYQITGYFAITSRYGTPEEFASFVEECHKQGIKVILDWVPAHFPKDENGLINFDGTSLYEYSGWDKRERKSWGTHVFDYGKCEVQSFLISSAVFLFDIFHIDGLRVDAVASMLYLDYDKKPNEWIPNSKGNNKNLEAISFLQKLNSVVFNFFPFALMIAEESTAWPLVTKPTDIGGLGFNFKWNIGWMNDVLEYVSLNPFFRKDNHNKLTFSFFYAFSENFILPISHDEVVHGKRSLLDKMSGDYNQKFETFKTFILYMFCHPGKKLNFMGTELAQFKEWDYKNGLDFCLLDFERHRQMKEFVKNLNWFYKTTSPLFEIDFSWEGFEWVVADDNKQNILVFRRKDKKGKSILCVINFSPVERKDYCIGVPFEKYTQIFSTLDNSFGGNGYNYGVIWARRGGMHNMSKFISLDIQPLSAVVFKEEKNEIVLR